ncbi:ribonuclease E inhibitor RraB [Jiella endophytica]|uniref:Ribonuclease E inhibitor RraB n=1 Tax=Jiella endophytica TaxID=2558362 RepID=A0A4Y8RT31_9HYPH|nr:ribonuclease E inhibitor RraB [Jiella endophytica]
MSLFEENAAILRNMAVAGDELGPPRSVDFSHVFSDQASAEAFARDAEREGFAATVEQVGRDADPWEVKVSKDMVPTCRNITGTERR